MLHENLGNTALRRAIRVALTGGTIAASYGVAHAQTAAPAAAPADNANNGAVAEVVVTGTRISVPNQVSISPVTFVSAAQIQQTGATRIEDMLNTLPQVFAAQGSNIVNGGDETATVNLRGLNAKRTLVLVNGLRLGPGDPRTGGASDVNMVPAELIDSVEILTGGASSVYGADAVAGVVNFKLNDHFEGVKLIADGGIYQHHNTNNQGAEDVVTDFNTSTGNHFASAPSTTWDGANKSLAFIAGLNSADGNGNATFYATYRSINDAIQSHYATSACSMNSGFIAGSSNTGGKFTCGGSGTTNPARFFQLGATGLLNDNTLSPTGQLIPYSAAHEYNFGPLNYFMRPDDRYTAGAFVHYDFNDHASVYANSMFMDDRSVAQIAQSGAFQTVYNVNCTNPFLTAQEVGTWCGANSAATGAAPGTTNLYIGRRSVEGGDRIDDVEHTDFRLVLGIKGKINDAWDYDANYQYGFVNLSETFLNDISKTKIADALNVVNVAGVPTCAALAPGAPPPNGAATGCVPWNVFNIGGVTPAQTAYLNTPGLQRGQIKQQIVNVNFTGDLGKWGLQSPLANNGIKVNLGGEYHDQRSFTDPDFEFQSGDLAGQGGPILPVDGGISSREAFIEMNVPIAEDKPFIQSLAFTGGYRYANFSVDNDPAGFKTNTFKVGLEWSPMQDYRFRASFSRASRAPNAGELFTVDSVGLDGNSDPCAGTPSFSAAACARTGVTAAQYGHILANSAQQYNGFTGGNPALQPETALTSSFGLGWTPSYVPNLRVQLDYYDIKIEDVIETIGADTILQECLTSDLFCNLIHRNAAGSLWLSNQGFVIDSLQNVGQLEEKGVDIDISYAYDVGALGKLHLDDVATYLNDYTITPIASNPGTARNCVGFYGQECSSFTAGAGTPVFRWRNTMRLTWSTPWTGLDVSAAWRYFSPTLLETLSSNPNLGIPGATVANGGISSTDARIPSYSYLDLTAAMNFTDKIQFRVGCNNVLDKQAPIIGASNLPSISGNGNTFPQVYDALGRFIFGTLTVQF